MKPMKNQTSEGNCNHRDNHSAETMCHTKHDKNARKILGLCAGYVWLESITTQCCLTRNGRRVLQPIMFHGFDFELGKDGCPEDFNRERSAGLRSA